MHPFQFEIEIEKTLWKHSNLIYLQDSFHDKLTDFAHLSESVNERTSKDRVK